MVPLKVRDDYQSSAQMCVLWEDSLDTRSRWPMGLQFRIIAVLGTSRGMVGWPGWGADRCTDHRSPADN